MKSKEEFCQRVYQLVRQVPEGRVTTYGAIAKAMGEPNASRRVGYAMRVSGDVRPPIPAHRVVNSSGGISCRSTRVQEFLDNEGIEIRQNSIIGFKKLFWACFK